MKKIIFLLCIIMVFTTACGGSKPAETKNEEPKTSIADKVKDKEKDVVDAVDENLTEYKFFKAALPEGWKVDEEDKYESDTSQILRFLNKEGKLAAKVETSISDSANDFRQSIVIAGNKLEDYVNKSLKKAKEIGGLYGLESEYYFFGEESLKYRLRDEASKLNVLISVSGKELSEDAKKFLDSIVFTAEDVGYKDYPYPYEGARIEPTLGKYMLGTINIGSEYLKLKEPLWTYDTFDAAGVQAGEYFYLLNRQNLHIFKLGEELEEVKLIDLGEEYEVIQADNNGKVYVSDFMQKLKVFQGLEQVSELAIENYAAISADGSWGIAYFTGTDKIEKFTIGSDGAITKQLLNFVGKDGAPIQKMVNRIFILGDKIGISGYASDDSGHLVVIYDSNGKEIVSLRNSDGKSLGSVTGLIEGTNGYLASDANMREFIAWNKDGGYLGKVEDGDLFGTKYPWFASFGKSPDGNNYLVMTEERADKSANEILVFKINTDI